MAITTETTKAKYVGNGVATEFPGPFPVFDARHVHVFAELPDGGSEELTTGFKVQLEANGQCTVLFAAPVAAGRKLVVIRRLPYLQNLDLQNGGNFNADEIEMSLDELEMQVQQLSEEVGRAVKLSVTDDRQVLTAEEIYEQVAGAVGIVNEVREQAEDARDRAETAAATAVNIVDEVKSLSIAVGDAPYGQRASGSYNPETGMLTLVIPEGKHGEDGAPGPAGPPGQAPTVDVISCGGAYETQISIINGGSAHALV